MTATGAFQAILRDSTKTAKSFPFPSITIRKSTGPRGQSHAEIRRGDSRQWLICPTNPRVRFGERGGRRPLSKRGGASRRVAVSPFETARSAPRDKAMP